MQKLDNIQVDVMKIVTGTLYGSNILLHYEESGWYAISGRHEKRINYDVQNHKYPGSLIFKNFI